VVCIHWTLKSLQINLSIPTTPSTSSGNISSSPQSGLLLSGATAALNVEIHAKLPKLEMRRFNGQPTEWQAFIDCFDSAVHSNPKLSNIDKMNYLKSRSSFNQRAALDIGKLQLGTKDIIWIIYLNCQSSVLSMMLRGSDNWMTKQKFVSEAWKLWA